MEKTESIEKQNVMGTNYYDSILMLILNEKAFSAGLIDQNTKDRITNEICKGERLKLQRA